MTLPDFHIRVADGAATGGDCLTKTKGTSRSKALAILSDKPYKTKRKLRFRERHSLTSVFQDDAVEEARHFDWKPVLNGVERGQPSVCRCSNSHRPPL